MDYKVSVIIPLYNAEKTLERAFLSVKNQTIGFENIELLLCDDCSTDGSYAMIQKWAKEYPNVRAFKTKKNSGTAGAPRNVCLDNATAPYIMFLDSDDAYLEQACEKLYAEITADIETDTVSGGVIISNTEEIRVSKKNDEFDFLLGIKEDVLSIVMTGFWTKIYRKEVLERQAIRFPENCAGEDIAFLLSYLGCSRRARIVAIPVVCYTIHENSASHKQDTKYYQSIPKAIMSGLSMAARQHQDKCYLSVLGYICFVDGYIEELLEQDFSPEEMEAIFNIWEPLLSLCSSGRLNSKSPYAEILIRDMCVLKDTEKALSDFYLLKKINAVQKAQLEEEKLQRRKELDDIYGSTTWKVASALQKLKFWSK